MLHDLQKHRNSTEVPNGQEYTIFLAEFFTFFFIPFEASGWNFLIQNILYII
jgi:hypothetical protein